MADDDLQNTLVSQALQKAQGISAMPMDKPTTFLPTLSEESDPIRKFLSLFQDMHTNAGLGAASPIVKTIDLNPELLKQVGNLPRIPPAASELFSHLMRVHLPPSEAIDAASAGIVGGPTPGARSWKGILYGMEKRNPDLAGQFTIKNSDVSRAGTGLTTRYAREAAARGRVNRALEAAKPPVNPVSVKSAAELGDVTTKPPVSAPPQLTGSFGAGARAAVLSKLAKSGLNEDIIRKIRSMSLEEAQKAFPNVKYETLRGIHKGDSYAWIK